MLFRRYYAPRCQSSRRWVWASIAALGLSLGSIGICVICPTIRLGPTFTVIFLALTAITGVAAEVSYDGELCREWWHPMLK